jgi:hypothetical protein
MKNTVSFIGESAQTSISTLDLKTEHYTGPYKLLYLSLSPSFGHFSFCMTCMYVGIFSFGDHFSIG